jgi:hypothetical protein
LEEAINEIGHVTHFFSKINVGIIELMLPLSIDDHILVRGPQRAEGGQSVGLKLVQLAREKDVVYKKLQV